MPASGTTRNLASRYARADPHGFGSTSTDQLIPRIDFERMVKQTKAEHRAKGLSSWSQFVAMLFCQLGRAHSLREIEGGLKSCEGKLANLGIEAPACSSLSYANAYRPAPDER